MCTWCKRMRVKCLYSELHASLSSSEGHLMSVLPSFCLSWEPVPHPVAPAYHSIMHQGLISQMQPSANPVSPQARSGSMQALSSDMAIKMAGKKY